MLLIAKSIYGLLMYKIVVQKIFGNWKNIGPCRASGSHKNCGSGEQFQIRLCIDGTVDKCTEDDRRHVVSCNLADCEKILGIWTDDGGCIASNAGQTCGPSSGTQRQVRTCIAGTNDHCRSNDGERAISCDLPDCPGEQMSIDSVFKHPRCCYTQKVAKLICHYR